MELSEVGDIQLCQLIGEGSFGVVRLGRWKSSQGECAVKLEPFSLRKRLLHQEFTAMTALRNIPGVPLVYEYGTEQQHAYMSMQLLSQSLSQEMRINGGRLAVELVLKYATQMIETLEAVHSAGYIHRDIKPQNLLLGHGIHRESVFLIDFGLSKRWLEASVIRSPLRDSGKITGTLPFVSLSVQLGCTAGRKDDLESLAYVLLYALKGELPWCKAGDSEREMRYHKETTDLSLFCRNLPIEFETLVQYTRNLSFDEQPDYELLKRAFQFALNRCKSQPVAPIYTRMRSKSIKIDRKLGGIDRVDGDFAGSSVNGEGKDKKREKRRERKPKLVKERTIEKLFEGFSNRSLVKPIQKFDEFVPKSFPEVKEKAKNCHLM